MSQIHDREMSVLGGLADATECMERVMRANVRVTGLVLCSDRHLIPDDVWQAALDAAAVTHESSA